jgi:hypothetical protein
VCASQDRPSSPTAEFGNIMGILDLRAPERLIVTAYDFLVGMKPKKFADEYKRDQDQFVAPLPFLLSSIGLAGVAYYTAYLAAGDTEVPASLLARGSLIGGLLILSRLLVVLIARLIAGTLALLATFRQLFKGFCYSSILIVPFSAAVAIIQRQGSDSVLAILTAVVADLLFLSYASVSMGRFLGLSRSFGKFVGLNVLVNMVLGVSAGILSRKTQGECCGLGTADVQWNIHPKDFETLRVWNASRTPLCSDCWEDTVIFQPGDTVQLALYYHQSSEKLTAKGVRVRLVGPATISSSASFSASLWSLDADVPVTGTVKLINEAGSECNAMLVAIQRFSRQREVPLLNSEKLENIFSERGLLLGDVPPGWNNQGTVVAHVVCK